MDRNLSKPDNPRIKNPPVDPSSWETEQASDDVCLRPGKEATETQGPVSPDDSAGSRLANADADIREQEAAIRKQEAEQTTQNTAWRKWLFWVTLLIVFALSFTNIVLIIIYTCRASAISATALSTWIVGSAAQVIGLLAIITRHLFPQANGQGKSHT
ncbi:MULTISPECIES: hypothetical protein [unclassified Actinobaculum]|uniref:hypothetical protein n=1 Tax=unclassified Actinobaculum TaxID=2609299 RepID=UPI000F741F02|nr:MULTISPECIES: hypothetical protein [unclassified Actinobaculum]RTE48010.1 hypothetical protein EKN07_11065 [Actinobaculum sp. 352]